MLGLFYLPLHLRSRFHFSGAIRALGLLAGAISLVAGIGGCSESAPKSSRPLVGVTVVPQLHFLEQLAGDRIEGVVLVPPGANPHSWEPKPSQMEGLARARVFFSVGLALETVWIPRLQALNASLKVVSLVPAEEDQAMDSAHFPPVRDFHDHSDPHEHEHSEDCDHDELAIDQGHKTDAHENAADAHYHGSDPHFWTSPRQVARMLPILSAELVRMDTAGRDFFQESLKSFQTRVMALDSAFSAVIAALPPANRHFLVYHPVFGDLARDYGLTQHAVEVDGKEPRPAQLAQIVREAKESGIRVVFVQPQFPGRVAESLAREIEGSVVRIDPLSLQWEEQLRIFLSALADSGK